MFLPEALSADTLREAVIPIAALKPHYLCVCTNVNSVALRQASAFQQFADAFKAVYPQIKEVAPHTLVSVGIQYEVLAGNPASQYPLVRSLQPQVRRGYMARRRAEAQAQAQAPLLTHSPRPPPPPVAPA